MAFGKRKKKFKRQSRAFGLLNHRLLLAGGALALAALFLLGQFGDAGIASWWKLRAVDRLISPGRKAGPEHGRRTGAA